MGPAGSWLEVAPAGAESRLVLYPKAIMPNWNELKTSIVFECDDVQATYQAMVERGVEFTGEPRQMAWGTFAKLRDPEGNEYLLRG